MQIIMKDYVLENKMEYREELTMVNPGAEDQIPEPEKVRIEEILRLLLFLCLGIYAVCHMLILPIEALVIAYIQDPYFASMNLFIYGVFIAKYVSVFLMFYCVYHHTNLWLTHHHVVLYIFSILTLLVTAFFAYWCYHANEEMQKHGLGPLIEHPFFYDFIGLSICGIQGCIYIFYLACTKPPVSGYLPVEENPSAELEEIVPEQENESENEEAPVQPEFEPEPEPEPEAKTLIVQPDPKDYYPKLEDFIVPKPVPRVPFYLVKAPMKANNAYYKIEVY